MVNAPYRTARTWDRGTATFQTANPFLTPRTPFQMTPKSPTSSTVSSLYLGSSTSDTPRSTSSMNSSTVMKNVSSEFKGKDSAGLPHRTKTLELSQNRRAFGTQIYSTAQRMQGTKLAHERSLLCRVELCDDKSKSLISDWKSPLGNVMTSSTSMKPISKIHSCTKSAGTPSTQVAMPHREPPTTVASVPRVARAVTAPGQTLHNVDSKPLIGGGKPRTCKDLSLTLIGPSVKPAQDKNGNLALDKKGLSVEMKHLAVFVANIPSVEQSVPFNGKRHASSRSQLSLRQEFVYDHKVIWQDEKSVLDDSHKLTLKPFCSNKAVEMVEQPIEKSGDLGKPGLDGHRLLVKVSFSDKTVETDVQVSSNRLRPATEFSPGMVILDDSGGMVLGRDSLPITRDEVALDFDGDFILSHDGHVVLKNELKFRDDGALIGPDGFPIDRKSVV